MLPPSTVTSTVEMARTADAVSLALAACSRTTNPAAAHVQPVSSEILNGAASLNFATDVNMVATDMNPSMR